MAILRTHPTARIDEGRQPVWSWRVRKQSEPRVRDLELPTPPADEDLSGELRIESLVRELTGLLDCVRRRETVDRRLVEQIAGTLIRFGLETDARRLYFDPGATVRTQASGEIKDTVSLPEELHAPLLAVLTEFADLDTEARRPQEGRLRVSEGERRFQLLLTCLPSVQGVVAVLHLPPSMARLSGFTGFGVSPETLAALEPALNRVGGMILVAGSAGSGVALTLYTLLDRVNHSTRRALTIEDPVEYLLPRVTQLGVDPAHGLTFPEALRTCLREQPDTIMLSDLPDPETASFALQAARSGRKILAGVPDGSRSSRAVRLDRHGGAPVSGCGGTDMHPRPTPHPSSV